MLPLCGIWELDQCIEDLVDAVTRVLFKGIFALIEEALTWVMVQAIEFIIGTVGSLWITVPTIPISEGGADFTPTPAIAFVQGRIMWLAIALATLSVIVAGTKMALSHRGEHLREVTKSLAIFLMVTGVAVGFVTVLIRLGDGLADIFIADVIKDQAFEDRINDAVAGPMNDLTLPLVLVLGIAVILTCVIQLGLMFVRNGMIVILIGVLPLAAAATNTEMGKAWFRKLTGWLAAFVAYKPVAALIYATAIRLFSDDSGGVAGMIRVTTGVTMMVMAVVAMPALIRFVAPKGA